MSSYQEFGQLGRGRPSINPNNTGHGVGSGTGNTPGPARHIVPPAQLAPTSLRSATFRANTEPLPPSWGSIKGKGAQIWVEEPLSNGSTIVMWAINYGPTSAVTNITVDGAPIATFGMTLGVNYNIYLGTSGQITDPLGVAALGTRWSTLPYPSFSGIVVSPGVTANITYVVAVFPPPGPGQSQPNFDNFKCDHDGLLVCDPLQDPTLATKYFVAEPVLAHADYWTSKVYGKGEPVSSIDWSGSVSATTTLQRANIGGGTKRYQIALTLLNKASHDQNSDIIRAHGQGLPPVMNGGLWQFWMDWAQAPSGVVLTDSGPNANIITAGPWRFTGRQQRPTETFVTYPNPSGIAKTETTPANDDPLLASGLVELVQKTWNLDGCPTDDQAQRLARYFRKSSAIDRTATIRLANDGIQILPYIVVTVTSQRLHCTNAQCVVLSVANTDPSSQASAFDITVQPYDASVYDDTLGSVTSTTPGAYSSPHSQPPTPAAPTLTQEGFNVRVDFGLPSTYPFNLKMKITVQQAGFSEYTLGEAQSGPMYLKGVTMGSLYTVRAYLINWALLVSAVASSATITPAMAQIPAEVINLDGVVGSALSTQPLGAATIHFDKPVDRSATLYGVGSLTATNLHSYDGTKVNDGNISTACFDWNVAGASRLSFSLGSAKNIREVWIYTSAFASDPNIQVSDDGITWSGFSGNPDTVVSIGGGVTLRIYSNSGGFGSHAYIALTKATTGAEATTFTEVWPREYGSNSSNIDHYNIYSVNPSNGAPWSGTRQLFNTVPYGSEPTSANPLDVNAIAYHNPSSYPPPWGVSGSNNLNLVVTTVSASGVESFGVGLSRASAFAAVGSGPFLDSLTLPGPDVPSAATTDIGASGGLSVNVTGTTTITSLGTKTAGVVRIVTFAGILTLTNDAIALILPGAASITTAAGDVGIFESLGSGNWRCINYMRAAASPIAYPIAVAQGGTGSTTAIAARSALNVESGTGHGDSIYSIVATDRFVYTNAPFTAARVWTLPAANAVNAGGVIIVADLQGTVTATNTLTISRAGSDTINGAISITINEAYGMLILVSNQIGWSARLINAPTYAPQLTTGTLNAVDDGTYHIIKPLRWDWTTGMVQLLSGSDDVKTICTLQPKTVVLGAFIIVTAAATGPTTVTASLGRVSATFTDYIAASDIKAAANTKYGGAITGWDFSSASATTLVKIRFISTGSALNTVAGSTGSVYLITMTLP